MREISEAEKRLIQEKERMSKGAIERMCVTNDIDEYYAYRSALLRYTKEILDLTHNRFSLGN